MGFLIAYLLAVLTAIPSEKNRKHVDNESGSSDLKSFQDAPIPILGTSPTPVDEEGAQYKKKDRRKTIKFWAEIGGLVILAFYTGFTYRIMRASVDAAQTANSTFGEIQKQTLLMRQQLIGTQGAIVSINGVMGAGPLPTLSNNVNISIGLKNEGHVIANAVHIQAAIRVIQIAGEKRIGREWSCESSITVLPPDKPQYRQCVIKGLLSNEDLTLIASLKRTIGIDGSYTYDNGFGETKTEPMCFRYAPQVKTKYGMDGSGHFVTCTDFSIEHEIVLRRLLET
jgi:hypothetical protein